MLRTAFNLQSLYNIMHVLSLLDPIIFDSLTCNSLQGVVSYCSQKSEQSLLQYPVPPTLPSFAVSSQYITSLIQWNRYCSHMIKWTNFENTLLSPWKDCIYSHKMSRRVNSTEMESPLLVPGGWEQTFLSGGFSGIKINFGSDLIILCIRATLYIFNRQILMTVNYISSCQMIRIWKILSRRILQEKIRLWIKGHTFPVEKIWQIL